MPSTKIIEVLYCCSDSEQDEYMRQKLEKHLSILKSQGVISSWYPGMISAGKEWEREIDTHIKTADIILLLISSDFIASPYHWNVMVQRAMEQRKARKARVIPVLLRRVDNWKVAFGNLKALPDDERPITNWRTHDDAFANIAEGIRNVAYELTDSTFPIKKSLRQIRAVVMPVANVVANAFVNVASATLTYLSGTPRSRRRNRSSMIPIEQFLIIAVGVGGIALIPQLSHLLQIPSSQPNPTINSTNSTSQLNLSGWIWIGLVNSNSSGLSVGERLLQPSNTKTVPSIAPPVVPSVKAVVTVKNPVNLRKNRRKSYNSDLPEQIDILKPGEKLTILKVERLVNPDPNSSSVQIWAQVGRCNRTCDK